jgi:hypothetical protein
MKPVLSSLHSQTRRRRALPWACPLQRLTSSYTGHRRCCDAARSMLPGILQAVGAGYEDQEMIAGPRLWKALRA